MTRLMRRLQTNLIFVLLGAFVLGGCAGDGFKSTVKVINTTTYPELPDIEPLPPLGLLKWKHDVPRDMDKVQPKSLMSCINVPENKRNEAYWRRCWEHPPLPNTNIFVGFDQTNWLIIFENFAKLRERLFQYQARLDAVNKQRKEWRDLANKERVRVKAEESKVTGN